MTRRPARAAAILGLAGWLAALVLSPAIVPSLTSGVAAAGASQALTVVANARYDVQPSHKRVHVTVDLQIANHRTDTVIRSYFFDHVVLGTLPGASGFTIAAPVGSKVHPVVHVTSRTSARVLVSVGFGTKLRSGHALGLKLTFDLADSGGPADRAVRIGSTIATFPVWAIGTPDTPGSTVRVTVPAGYQLDILGSPMTGPTAGPSGTRMYASVVLGTPAAFGAYILADRPGAYRETPLGLTVAGGPYAIVVRAWQDDPAFGTRVSALLKKALPALGTLVGIPPTATGPGGAPFAVEEAVTRSAGGYAALFDGGAARIQVAYDAGSAVLLHEAAHAWFNGAMVADRWAAEGFASYYASRVAGPLKIAVPALTLTKALQARGIPLNAWASTGTPDPAVDAYGMAASNTLAGLIADRVGPSGLSDVWQAIVTGAMADQPAHETGSIDADPSGPSVPDWRGLLDLIETRTGKDVSDLWRTWVVRPEEAALLDRRATVRTAYAGLVAEAGDWEVAKPIRVALDRWQFDQAADLIAKAHAVLAALPALATAAETVGVRLPATVRTAFESDSGPASAATELAAEQAAVARLAADFAERPAVPGPVVQVGLVGTDPDADIDAARTAFAAGDLAAAVTAADRAAAVWDGALDAGRERLALVAGILAVFAALVLLVTATHDHRSRARWSYRAGQVIRTMSPGSFRGVGPRSGAAYRSGDGDAIDGRAGAGRAAGQRASDARTSGGRPPGVHVTVRQAEHQSPVRAPMAHPIGGGPVADGTAASAGTRPAGPRSTVAPSGAYGTLAANPPAGRPSANGPTAPTASDGRPGGGSRPRDDPADRASGEH